MFEYVKTVLTGNLKYMVVFGKKISLLIHVVERVLPQSCQIGKSCFFELMLYVV